MTSNKRGRELPAAHAAPVPEEGAIGPPHIAQCILVPSCTISIDALVLRLRGNFYLRRLASFSGPDRRRSSARFVTDLAAVSSLLTAIACDVLFLCFSKQDSQSIRRRHGPALEALELLYEMLARPAALAAFGYSREQTDTTIQFFGKFVGAGGLDSLEPDDWWLRRAADRRPQSLEEAPFLQPLLFLLLSRRLPLLALAECLSMARFGFWSADRRTFFPDVPTAHTGGLRWAVQTMHTADFGHVVVSFSGPAIDAVRFQDPWPRTRFREGSHFMERGTEEAPMFRLPLVKGSTTVFKTAAAPDGLF